MKTEKVKFINKSSTLLFAFLLLGIILRLIGIRTTDGLWYDEINTYLIAKQQFPMGIFNQLVERDFHLPFYYMFLHLWMNVFGDSDLALRISSVIFGILTLPIAYLAGKELAGPKLGLVTLMFFSVNAGLIHYSQEVRFYSILAFLATLSLLFLIKIKNNPSKLNYLGLVISNLFIIYTFTAGFIFVFIEMAIFLVYLIYAGKHKKDFLLSNLIILILSMPLVPLFICFGKENSNLLFNYFDYYSFKWEYILSVVESISGILRPFYTIVDKTQYYRLALISTIIFIIGLKNTFIKRNFVTVLLFIGLLPLSLEFILTLLDKFAFTYNHSILFIPFLIISAGYGLLQIKEKKLCIVLLIIYLASNLIYFCFSPFYSVIFAPKANGFNAVANKLKEFNANEQDALIMLPFGGYLGIKYAYKAKVVPLSLNDYSLNSKYAFKYIFDKDFVESLNKVNTYYNLKDFAHSKTPTANYKRFIQGDIGNKIPLKRYIFVIMPEYLVESEYKYKKRHMITFIWQKIAKDTLFLLKDDKRFKSVKFIKYRTWSFYVFQRIK